MHIVWDKNFCHVPAHVSTLEYRGGSRIFSRGGADFQKFFENFVNLFVRSTEFIFQALPKHGLVPVLGKFCAPQAKF